MKTISDQCNIGFWHLKKLIITFIFIVLGIPILQGQSSVLEFLCPDDATTQENIHPDDTGWPIVENNSLLDTVYFFDEQHTGCSANGGLFSRFWYLKDTNGIIENCTQIITIPNEYHKIKVPNDTIISIHDLDENWFSEVSTNMPSNFGIELSPNEYKFYLILSVSDLRMSEFQIRRYFAIFDWCFPEVGPIAIGSHLITAVPAPICPPDTMAVESLLPIHTGFPGFQNEAFLDTSYYKDYETTYPCDPNYSFLERTWTIVDIFGNESNCVQNLKIIKDLTNAMLPPDVMVPYCEKWNPNIEATGLPTIYGIPLSPDYYVLALGLVYQDVEVSSFEVRRYFTIINWCMPTEVINLGSQLITYDTEVESHCSYDVVNSDKTNVILDINGNTTTQYQKIDACHDMVYHGSIIFTDDGLDIGEYYDDRIRSDTIEICASGNNVKIVFTEFDLENGDTLFAYHGSLTDLRTNNSPMFSSATGNGVFRAFGGWIYTACLNTSGCLTFIFKTNGDGRSDNGWKALWDCGIQDSDNDTVSDCDDLCPNGDDRINTDGVGMPDACDCNPNDANDEYVHIASDIAGNGKIPFGTHRASFELRSDGLINKRGATSFLAGRTIILEDGFTVPAGSQFSAKIDPNCSSDNTITAENSSFKNRIVVLDNQEITPTVSINVYPNPFQQNTNINYSLPIEGTIHLALYDLWGREVQTIQKGFQYLGDHRIILEQGDLPAGVYYLSLKTKGVGLTKKLIIVE